MGSPSPLVVLGASGHAAVVAEAAEASGVYEVVAFLVTVGGNDGRTEFQGRPLLLGPDWSDRKLPEGATVIVAIGANHHRRRLAREAESLGFRRATVVHPTASVSRSARVGAGTVVLAGAVVASQADVGEDVIINNGSTVDHDCELEPGVHLSPGVHLGGHVHIGEESWLGVGVSVRDRVSIGSRTIVGVGAAVVGDLPGGVVAFGVPARIMERR